MFAADRLCQQTVTRTSAMDILRGASQARLIVFYVFSRGLTTHLPIAAPGATAVQSDSGNVGLSCQSDVWNMDCTTHVLSLVWVNASTKKAVPLTLSVGAGSVRTLASTTPQIASVHLLIRFVSSVPVRSEHYDPGDPCGQFQSRSSHLQVCPQLRAEGMPVKEKELGYESRL